MNTDTKIILGALLASVVIIVAAAIVLGKDNRPKREQLGQSSLQIDKTIEDFGSMKNDEERTATFTITNTSPGATLRIWNIATSCDCTFASVVIAGRETGEFNMTTHTPGNLKNWIGEIPAGQPALLKVTYKPKVMPVIGPVTRQVNFSTNDPKNPEVQVSISANVL